jgi:sporulation protein YlmC with PRC-barrel domain
MFTKSFQMAFIASICTASLAYSQDTVKVATPKNQVQDLSKLDSKTEGISVRATKLIGMHLHNSNKENVGQIKDLVLNPTTSRIQYAAVTYGGFLGIGDKMFAVPLHAIKVAADPDRQGHVLLVLDVTKEQLAGAQGFDEEHWPDFSDSKFSGEIHRRYGVLDLWNRELSGDSSVGVRVGRSGVSVEVDGAKK